MTTSHKVARGRSTAVKAQIDENLKRVYQDALDAEVPDRFKQLLDQLRQAETAGRQAAGPRAENDSQNDNVGQNDDARNDVTSLQAPYFPGPSGGPTGAASGNVTTAGGGGAARMTAAPNGTNGIAPRTPSETIE